MAAQANLTTTVRAEDKASAALTSAAESALELAKAELAAAKAAETASDTTGKARKATVSASKQVSLAMAEEAAAGNPLRLKIAQLNTVHAELKAQMAALAKAGKPIPPQLLAAAAAASKSTAALKRHTAEQRTATTTGTSLKDSIKSAAVAYIGLATAMRAVRAVKDLIIDQIEAGDALSKTSQKLGVGIEALQEYQFAAGSAGVESTKLNDALKFLNRSSADAAAGNKSLSDAFASIGVDVKTATGRFKTVEELLPEVADGLAGVEDQGIRTSAMMLLMGRSGADLLPMLQGGSAGLEAMASRAREVGTVMSEETSLAAEATAQAVFELSEAVDGLQTALAADAIPAIKDLALALTDVVSWVNQNKTAMAALEIALMALTMPISSVVSGLSGIIGELDELSDLDKEIAAQQKVFAADLAQAEREAAARGRAAKVRAAERAKAEKEASKEIIKAREAEEKAREAADAKAEKDDLKRLNSNIKNIQKLEKEREKAAEKELANVKKQQDAMVALAEKSREESAAAASAAAESWGATAIDMGSTFGTMFAELAAGEKTAAEVILGVMDDLVAKAVEMATEFLLLEAAKASAAAVTAHAGIPFIGLAVGLTAAAAIFSAIMGMATFAEGGLVAGGTPGRDSVRALLMPGEGVLSVEAVQAILKSLRGGGASSGGSTAFAGGGVVSGAGAGGINVTFNLPLGGALPSRPEMDRFVRDAVAPSMRRLQRSGAVA